MNIQLRELLHSIYVSAFTAILIVGLSSCAPRFYSAFLLDTDGAVIENVPSHWAITGIANGSTSPLYDLEITADYETDGTTFQLYTDNTCTTPFGASTPVASGAVSIQAQNAGTEGNIRFYYVLTLPDATVSACTDSTLSYNYVKPKIAFSQSGYSVREDGTEVGPSVTIVRDRTGITSQVDLKWDPITAEKGIHYDNSSFTVNFGVNDTSITINPSEFQITNLTGTESGDRTVHLRLDSADAHSKIAEIIEDQSPIFSQLNIMDQDLPDGFWFTSPLYTAHDSEPSVSVQIHRSNNVGAASFTINYSTHTAHYPADFESINSTVNFANGDFEATLTISFPSHKFNLVFKSYCDCDDRSSPRISFTRG